MFYNFIPTFYYCLQMLACNLDFLTPSDIFYRARYVNFSIEIIDDNNSNRLHFLHKLLALQDIYVRHAWLG